MIHSFESILTIFLILEFVAFFGRYFSNGFSELRLKIALRFKQNCLKIIAFFPSGSKQPKMHQNVCDYGMINSHSIAFHAKKYRIVVYWMCF